MAFFLEAKPQRQPFLRAPASVIGLIAVLVATHLVRILSPAALSERILNDYALDPARYSVQVGLSLADRILPLFGHMFLHANTMHIAINCVWLLAFGPVVARRFGGVAFVVFFLLCGLAGAASYVVLTWGADVGVIGASGAISGLMGAAIRMMHVRQPYLNLATLPLMPIFSSQVLGFSGVWLVINLLTGIFGFGLTGQIEAVAWEDHMGGYLAGLLLAGLFERFVGLAAARSRRSA
jgi:membrane associated rhomboid family serine protease